MLRTLALTAALAALACQGPPARDAARSELRPFGSSGAGLTLGAGSPDGGAPGLGAPVILGSTLAPLAEEFDRHAHEARVVALLPARCEACASGLAAIQESLLDAFPGGSFHVIVVLPGDDRCDGCGAPVVSGVQDPRVSMYVDQEGCATRAFTRGLLPMAEAYDVFLFYPRGTAWGSERAAQTEGPRAGSGSLQQGAPLTASQGARLGAQNETPRAEEWWHRLGRFAPERHCAAQELDRALRTTMAQLLDPTSAASVAQQ
ncbi:MAG: hypothetical protein R3F49_11395 [Planctomycetota bacterium]